MFVQTLILQRFARQSRDFRKIARFNGENEEESDTLAIRSIKRKTKQLTTIQIQNALLANSTSLEVERTTRPERLNVLLTNARGFGPFDLSMYLRLASSR